MNNKIIIYTDGGARGNPGPAAIGVVVHGEFVEPIGTKKYAETIGETTNNVAEDQALIFGLKKARQLLGKEKAKEANIEIRTDSELIAKQLKGEYRVKEDDLKPLFIDVWNLKQDFKTVEFVHIPREKNREADELVNKALDGKKEVKNGLF